MSCQKDHKKKSYIRSKQGARTQDHKKWEREREREREKEKECTNDFGQVIYQRSPNGVWQEPNLKLKWTKREAVDNSFVNLS